MRIHRGAALVVVLSFAVACSKSDESTTPITTPANQAPVAAAVAIVDSANRPINQITLHLGDTVYGQYAYNDRENDPEGNSIYRWVRGTATVGTQLSYTLSADDDGQTLTFEVSPVAQSGTTLGFTQSHSQTITLENSAPSASNVNIVDQFGRPLSQLSNIYQGDTLYGSYTYNDGEADPEGNSLFRWVRGGTNTVSSEISYTLGSQDNGQTLSFEVTPVAQSGTGNGVAVTHNEFINLSNKAPVVSNIFISDDNYGTAIVSGDILTASYDYFDNEGDANASVFQWTRGTPPVDIPGANSITYTLSDLDVGQEIRFVVTAQAATGTIAGNSQSALVVEGNNHPVVVDNEITIPEIQPNIALIGIENDDTDADMDSLSVIGFDNTGTIGEAILNPTRGGGYSFYDRFDYLSMGEQGNDSFGYTISDGRGGYASGRVNIIILGANDRPIPGDDFFDVNENDSNVSLEVMSNDTDADNNDTLIISDVDIATHSTIGAVSIVNNGTALSYTPSGFNLAAGETATDQFIYTVDDQNGVLPNTQNTNIGTISTNTAVVTITVVGQ